MRIEFLSILGNPPSWFELYRDQYLKKLNAFFPTKATELKASKKNRERRDEKLKSESELLLKQIDPRDFLLLLDESGKAFDSVSFAHQLEPILASGKSRIVICCGGAYGSSDDLKSRADMLLSLSKFTFNHLLAQAIAYEQIYRALMIQRRLPYHNE